MIEVKTGRSESERDQRQAAAYSKLEEYLTHDVVTGHHAVDGPVRRTMSHAPTIWRDAEMTAALQLARVSGFGVSHPEPGLVYMVHTEPNTDGLAPIIANFRGKPIVGFVNQFKGNNVAYRPFTFSLLDAELLYEFYDGNLLLTVLIDSGDLEERLRANGIAVAFDVDQETAMELRRPSAGEDQLSSLKISWHFWHRLFAEFLSLEWLVNELVFRMEQRWKEPPAGAGPAR